MERDKICEVCGNNSGSIMDGIKNHRPPCLHMNDKPIPGKCLESIIRGTSDDVRQKSVPR